jgi:predicted nucleic acid-binding protein
MIVLDASVIAKWFLEEPKSSEAFALSGPSRSKERNYNSAQHPHL